MNLREKYGEWGIILGATEGVGKADNFRYEKACKSDQRTDGKLYADYGHTAWAKYPGSDKSGSAGLCQCLQHEHEC